MSKMLRPKLLNRPLTMAAFASIVFASSLAQGAGLGELKLFSGLNEPLDAQIEILDVKDEELSDLKASLGSEASYKRLGMDRNFELTQIQFKVRKNSKGQNILTLSTQKPMKEAYLDMLISLEWPQGSMAKDYTVLLDPPTRAASQYQDFANTNKTKMIFARDQKPKESQNLDEEEQTNKKLKAIENKLDSMTQKLNALREDNQVLQSENKKLENALKNNESNTPQLPTSIDALGSPGSDEKSSSLEQMTQKAAQEAIESLIDNNKMVVGDMQPNVRTQGINPGIQQPQDVALLNPNVGLDVLAQQENQSHSANQNQNLNQNTNPEQNPGQIQNLDNTAQNPSTETNPVNAQAQMQPAGDMGIEGATNAPTAGVSPAQPMVITDTTEVPEESSSFLSWMLGLLLLLGAGGGAAWYYKRSQDVEYDDFPPKMEPENSEPIESVGEVKTRSLTADEGAASDVKTDVSQLADVSINSAMPASEFKVSSFKAKESTTGAKVAVNPLRQSIIDEEIFNLDDDMGTMIDEKTEDSPKNADEFILQLSKDVDVYLQFERYDQAEAVLKSILERKKDYQEARFKLFGLYILLNKLDVALEIYNQFPKNLNHTHPHLAKQVEELYQSIVQGIEPLSNENSVEEVIDSTSSVVSNSSAISKSLSSLDEQLNASFANPASGKPYNQSQESSDDFSELLPDLSFEAPLPVEPKVLKDTLEPYNPMPSIDFDLDNTLTSVADKNQTSTKELPTMPALDFSIEDNKTEKPAKKVTKSRAKKSTSLIDESNATNAAEDILKGLDDIKMDYENPEYSIPEYELDNAQGFLNDDPDVVAQFQGLENLTVHEDSAVLARDIPLDPETECWQKLELAKASLEQGDKAKAQSYLEQVIAYGSKEQKNQAKSMLSDI